MTLETHSEHQSRPRLAPSDAGSLRTGPLISKQVRAALAVVASLLVLGGAAVSYAMAMRLPLSHDEHQFVVGGWLLGEHGLLPYRDFPFHHVPNLLFLYALLGRITPALLWNARMVSVLLGVGTFGLIFAFARQRHDGARGWFAGTAAVLLLLLSPLFEYTSGRAWNHALPTFLTVAAFLVHLAAARRSHVARWWVWSGVLLGLAVGSRLTYVSALVPFLAFMLIPPRFGSPRRSVAAFLAGFAGSLIPSLLLLALAPRQFLYGNVVHAILNVRYRQSLGYTSAMSFQGKLAYLAEDVLSDPAQALVFAVFVALVVIAAIRIRRGGQASGREFWFAAGVALFLFLSGFVPTPSWVQYFYAPVPFIALSLVIFATENETQARPIVIAVGILVVTLVTLRWETLAQVRLLAQREAWVPMQVHALGEEVAERTGDGRLLTLAPTVAAEGGLTIYPELAGGSLDWRIARSFSAERRMVYGLMAPEDLERKLDVDPPVGILVGFEARNEGFSVGERGGLEWPLDSYADANGYQPEEIRTPNVPGNLTLWTP